MSNLSDSKWAPAASSSSTAQRNYYDRPPGPMSSSISTSTSTATAGTTRRQQLSKRQRDLVDRRGSLARFHLLLRRLKWKSRALLYSHHRARHERDATVVGAVGFALEPGEAEAMFKVDFFEFYVLLERVLVCLLGGLGMVVTPVVAMTADTSSAAVNATGPNTNGSNGTADGATVITNGRSSNGPRSFREELIELHQQRQRQQQEQRQQQQQSGRLGDSTMFHGYAHRFHANVLAALDLPTNPLHHILGAAPVRDYLGIAKEFRNRWKDADEERPPPPSSSSADGENQNQEDARPLVSNRYEKMLADLQLEQMLEAILVAVETARPVVQAELDAFAHSVMGDSGSGDDMAMLMELDETPGDAPWEAMPDAMDWN